MAQDNFAAFHIEKACAAIVDNSRYNKTYSNAISLLANVATDYMRKIATKAYALTEIAGDNETTVEHVLMANEAFGIKTSDLIQYIKSNKPFTTKALPVFPVLPPSSISRSKLPDDILDCLCNTFCSCLIDENKLVAATASVPIVKVHAAKLPPQPKKKINPIIRPLRSDSSKMGDLFNQLHNDLTPFDFDGWEQSAAEIKLLTMPPIRYETADDMANAVKPPSYWEKRAQTAKYQNNFNWADQECSSDSEISLIDSVVLSPRPLDDPTPPIKLRDVIESSCVNPSRSIIRKDAISKNNNEKNFKNNFRPIRQKNANIIVRKANSNNDLQPKKIASNVLRAKSVANVITDRPLFNVPKLPRLEKNAVSKTCPLTAIEFPDIGGRLSEPSSEDESQPPAAKKGRKAGGKKGKFARSASAAPSKVVIPRAPRKTPIRQIKVETSQQPLRRSARKRVSPDRYAPVKVTPSRSLSQLSIHTAIDSSQPLNGIGLRQRTMRIPNSSAASSVANSKPTTPSLSEAATVSGMDSSRPGIKIVLRRAPLMAPTVASSDYEVVFCSTKSGTEGGETSNQ